MKVYAAIGHFKGESNTISIASTQNTKKDFRKDCYGNGFVPYVIITEKKFKEIAACDDNMEIWEITKKLTTNYRVWNIVADYLEQCLNILENKMNAAKELE